MREAALLRAALRPLDAKPPATCWNHAELEDLLTPAAELADAAVLVGLVAREAGATVLLTLRTDDLRHHGGQVSFPGGRVEAADADAIAAAIRETGEEIGVPSAQVSPIGLLDPLVTITGFRVLPVVAAIDPGYVAR
ncbi:MAG TPA: CoA pyrophosphatase, partial [Arenimonas sp.]|nr:CoA pyrophosphatase [Arenimonas sp.]